MSYLEPAYTVCDVFCAMTLRAINMTTVAHGTPFIHSFMYSYANMPLQLGLAIVLCDITVMLLYTGIFKKYKITTTEA